MKKILSVIIAILLIAVICIASVMFMISLITPVKDTITTDNIEPVSNEEYSHITSLWPEDAPAGIPRFTYGTITQVDKIIEMDITSWKITIVDVLDDAYSRYKADLSALGFMDVVSYETEDGWTIANGKDDLGVIAFFNDGVLSLTVTLGYDDGL